MTGDFYKIKVIDMQRIIVLNYHMACAGTEKAMIAFLNAIDYSKYKVTLYLMYKNGELYKDIPLNVEIKTIAFKHERYRFYVSFKDYYGGIKKLYYKVRRKIFKFLFSKDTQDIYEYICRSKVVNEPQCDILCDFCGYGYFQTVFGAERIKAKKKLMWLHDEKQEWLKRVEKWIPEYDNIICVSNSVKQKFDSTYPQYADRSRVIYNVIDVDDIRRKIESCKLDETEMIGTCKLLTVGRIVEQKGYDIAIEVAKKLKDIGIDYKWYFVGAGNEFEHMKNLIIKYQLTEYVYLLGQKENPYVYMKNCDLYIQPSRYEGYPVVLVEARALGCVIIASDIPSIREQIIDGENGFLCELNADAFVEKIKHLIDNPEEYKKISEKMKNEKINFSDEMNKFYDLIGE